MSGIWGAGSDRQVTPADTTSGSSGGANRQGGWEWWDVNRIRIPQTQEGIPGTITGNPWESSPGTITGNPHRWKGVGVAPRDPQSDGGSRDTADVTPRTREVVPNLHPGILLLLLIPGAAEPHREPPNPGESQRTGASGFSLKPPQKSLQGPSRVARCHLRVLPVSPPPLGVPGAVAACSNDNDEDKKNPDGAAAAPAGGDSGWHGWGLVTKCGMSSAVSSGLGTKCGSSRTRCAMSPLSCWAGDQV